MLRIKCPNSKKSKIKAKKLKSSTLKTIANIDKIPTEYNTSITLLSKNANRLLDKNLKNISLIKKFFDLIIHLFLLYYLIIISWSERIRTFVWRFQKALPSPLGYTPLAQIFRANGV
jgi:hypothetical protein